MRRHCFCCHAACVGRSADVCGCASIRVLNARLPPESGAPKQMDAEKPAKKQSPPFFKAHRRAPFSGVLSLQRLGPVAMCQKRAGTACSPMQLSPCCFPLRDSAAQLVSHALVAALLSPSFLLTALLPLFPSPHSAALSLSLVLYPLVRSQRHRSKMARKPTDRPDPTRPGDKIAGARCTIRSRLSARSAAHTAATCCSARRRS